MPIIRIADLTLTGQSEESIYGDFDPLTATPSHINRGAWWISFTPEEGRDNG